MKGCKAQIKWL